MWGTVLMYLPFFFIKETNEWGFLLLMMGCTGIIVLPFLKGYVELDDEKCTVKVGFIKKSIYYDKIKSIKYSNNFASSFALTSKRIEIKEWNKSWVTGTTYIGPINREEVYKELLRRCNNLVDKQQTDKY
jgi:hypothetical protein